MNRFRIQENVPQVYVDESRDFQMMCNVFDLVNNGVKFDIDTISLLGDSTKCPESLVSYLQNKLGFYSDLKMTDETLRTILKCFPYLVRLKGSRKGVVNSICLFLTVLGISGKVYVDSKNHVSNQDPSGNYIIHLQIEHKALDVSILKEILRYIIPTGYIVKYSFFQSLDIPPTITTQSDYINIIFVEETLNSGIKLTPTRTEEVNDYHYNHNNMVGNVSSSTIIAVEQVNAVENVDTKSVSAKNSTNSLKIGVELYPNPPVVENNEGEQV